ncbi:MAG: hypothetical protein K2X27_27370, partial [Candidatus Obscuribacterales bacterium]|nr:hypothetical protein [Candidatus Obscuribacterales bacterium]
MRCPECEQRNSVAASKCKFCGARFKRKEMPKGKKIVLISLLLLFLAVLYLIFALPKMVDPSEQLTSIAKRVAGGPKSPEDAQKSRTEFNTAVRNLLLRYAADNSQSLSKRLKDCLPANAFEVLVADLPKGLKLVEVDTVLQASDFLIMRGTNDYKVIPLNGFEVFDDARTVSDQAGAVLVLLGHSSGQPPHKPLIHTYALLPDAIVDESANMVPALFGEGSAKFSKDNSDINLEFLLPAMAQSERINMTPALAADKVLRTKLHWKDAKYLADIEFPQDLHSAVSLLARAMKHPELSGALTAGLGPQAGRLLKEHGSGDWP